VLDPGHGGPDPGTIGVSGYYEKNVALAAAREMARRLAATGRYRIFLTRTTDRYIALRDRVGRARAAKAELFISIHADAHPDRSTRGASVYTLSEAASDREAALLAAKENKADVVAGIRFAPPPPDISTILIDLAQRDTINRSRKFAALLLASLGDRNVELLGRSHRHAGFAVLTAPDTPAVLLEMGYLSNRQDERLLLSKAYQRRLGDSLIDAVDRYFASEAPIDVPPRPLPAASKRA
jgi:N-acetylmuramoyl-L-alanine amidase